MRSSRRHDLAVLLGATVIALALAEIGARLLVVPSEVSGGRLLGLELPPLDAFPESLTAWDTSGEAAGRLFEDGPLTYGDLWGIHREDSLLGYTALENERSRHGWWQSNEIGARARRTVSADAGSRVLVFGESFAQASRVRQEDAWTSVLDSLCTELDVVNFGVDGYSMGQAYLRYRTLGPVLEHDVMLLLFAPSVDLWREVNTLRSLRGWMGVPLVPRFVLEGEELKVIEMPYPDLASAVEENRGGVSWRLHDHLSRHDRFYCPRLYRVPPILGDLVLYKVAATVWCRASLLRRKSGLLKPDGEAARIVRAIFTAARVETQENGARFVLAIVPTRKDVENRATNRRYTRALDELERLFCSENECIDLTDGLSSLSSRELDHGSDGTHYGPLANRRIAEIFASRFGCHEATSGPGGGQGP